MSDWLSIDSIEEFICSDAVENIYLLAIWTLIKLEHYFVKRNP